MIEVVDYYNIQEMVEPILLIQHYCIHGNLLIGVQIFVNKCY